MTAAGGAVIAAGFIPLIRDHLFPWLETTALPTLAKHPALWTIVISVLLLPVPTSSGEFCRFAQPVGDSRPLTFDPGCAGVGVSL